MVLSPKSIRHIRQANFPGNEKIDAMRVEVNIYDSNRGDGVTYYQRSYDVGTFEEYKSAILDAYSRAESEGVIALISREGLLGEHLVWAPRGYEDRDIEVSTSVTIRGQSYTLFGCTVDGEEITFPVDGSYLADEWEDSCKDDLGDLDFRAKDFDEEELIEKLFNFYLTKV